MCEPDFVCYRAGSLAEAGQLLQQHPGAKLLAGDRVGRTSARRAGALGRRDRRGGVGRPGQRSYRRYLHLGRVSAGDDAGLREARAEGRR